MQAGLALPMAYYFHRATTIGLPANLIVVPLTQWMMPAAVLALALGYVSLWLAKLPVLVATVALNGITGTIQGLGGLHLADLRVGMPSAVMITFAVASLILAMWTARRRIVLTSLGLFVIFLVALAWAFVAPRPDKHSGVMKVTGSTSARAIRSSSLLLPGRRFWSSPEVPLAPAALNSTSEKTWSRPTCGNEASLTSKRWRLLMGTPITSAA